MRITTSSQLRKNLARILDSVGEDRDAIIAEARRLKLVFLPCEAANAWCPAARANASGAI